MVGFITMINDCSYYWLGPEYITSLIYLPEIALSCTVVSRYQGSREATGSIRTYLLTVYTNQSYLSFFHLKHNTQKKKNLKKKKKEEMLTGWVPTVKNLTDLAGWVGWVWVFGFGFLVFFSCRLEIVIATWRLWWRNATFHLLTFVLTVYLLVAVR